jgi:hypothetical protein
MSVPSACGWVAGLGCCPSCPWFGRWERSVQGDCGDCEDLLAEPADAVAIASPATFPAPVPSVARLCRGEQRMRPRRCPRRKRRGGVENRLQNRSNGDEHGQVSQATGGYTASRAGERLSMIGDSDPIPLLVQSSPAIREGARAAQIITGSHVMHPPGYAGHPPAPRSRKRGKTADGGI